VFFRNPVVDESPYVNPVARKSRAEVVGAKRTKHDMRDLNAKLVWKDIPNERFGRLLTVALGKKI
jgi:hypothetical protein